jgi:ligand-binding SRPBCC domain-containing protein
MVRGAFKTFSHRHTFHEQSGGTIMVDDLIKRPRSAPSGLLADKLFLERYMRASLLERAQALNLMAEAEPKSWA